MDNNNEKAITFEDLKFEQYDEYPSFSKRAFLTLDNGIRASVLECSAEGQERLGYKYGIILRGPFENYPLSLDNKGICDIAGATTDQKLIKMLNVASKFPYDEEYNPWFEPYESEHYKEYINLIDERDYSKNKPNEEKEFITWDDLKFEPYDKSWPSNWAHTYVDFDLGSLHIIKDSNEDGSINHYSCMKYTADNRQCCDAFDVYNTDKEYLNNFLRECQCEFGLNQNDELPKEKTETLKSAEKEDRAKQSAERIRMKKKSVSGVYVADKIGEAMRSGVVSETVTPEKGKQLSDNIKKKYIMDQQQKS